MSFSAQDSLSQTLTESLNANPSTSNCAALTAVAVNEPHKFPSLKDAFPSLFEKKEQHDWWLIKQRVENWGKTRSSAF
jgi:hypothetical protein